MSTKIRGSEKMMFNCDKNGKRSLADFENVEEALQASGGYYLAFPWEKFGQPGRDLLSMTKVQSFKPMMDFKIQPNSFSGNLF